MEFNCPFSKRGMKRGIYPKMKPISCDYAIMCIDGFGGIGLDGKLLTNNKTDMDFFKSKTQNSILVMGSKTFESLPNPSKMMRDGNRIGVVLTRNKNMELPFEFIAMTEEEFRCPKTFIEKLDLRFGNGEAIFRYHANNIVLIGGAYYYNRLKELGINKAYVTTLLEERFNTFPSVADTFVDMNQEIFVAGDSKTLHLTKEVLIEEYRQSPVN